jgi:glutathione S-transferase
MLKIFGRATSDSVQKAIWMLGETGQPFEHVELGGRFGGLGDADFLRLNPHGRVPTLCDGDLVV